MQNSSKSSKTARAYPAGDARVGRLTPVKNLQRLPYEERIRLKKIAQRRRRQRSYINEKLRIGTLNVGTLTGRSREVVDMMERRKIAILGVQETKWKGQKAKEIGGGYKLFYCGYDSKRNGVGIILDKILKENVLEVKRISDRAILLKLDLAGKILNVISAYAPQSGCDQDEKDAFWTEMDVIVNGVPGDERLLICGDLNGHVGEENFGAERFQGRYGVGAKNPEGERIVDFASAADLAILNTYYRKPLSQRITYRSGGRFSQLDYILYRRTHMKEVTDCKVLPMEGVSAQHKPVICSANLMQKKPTQQTGTPKTRWWKLEEKEMQKMFVEELEKAVRETNLTNETWKEIATKIRTIGNRVLGRTSGKGKSEKETWWWNTEVQNSLKEKKDARKKWDLEMSDDSRKEYNKAKKQTKKAVAKAKAEAFRDLYENLETEDGQKKIFRIAKQRDKCSKDVLQAKSIKAEDGRVLTNEGDILERWKQVFEKLMNEENPRTVKENVAPRIGPVMEVTANEVKEALGGMKKGKAVGPDNIPVEVWKCLGDTGITMLTELYNSVLKSEKMPDEWRQSILVPIFKNKGDIQNCSNYRGIKLMSHTMKIWERIVEKRLREDIEISEEQFGFMPGKSTIDAIFSLRQVMEKHREGRKDLTLVFIDLEKAFDRVPRSELWRCLRVKKILEKYVRVIQDMYESSQTLIRCAAGNTENFAVKVGVHQGSALSPLLFAIVMDVLSKDAKEEAPWSMMYADDIIICTETERQAEEKLEQWRKVLEEGGLRINRSKTEYMKCGEGEGEVKIQGTAVARVERFKYLGSTLQQNADIEEEIKCRIQAGWCNWRKVSAILCDKRIPAKLKGKIHKSVVRPAMLYGTETLQISKNLEHKMDVAEMRMLRWASGVTKKDRVRNEALRGTLKVGKISEKVREARLRWYGHVKRREPDHVTRKALEMCLPGKRSKGRPKMRWTDCVMKDFKELGLSDDMVADRRRWRRAICSSDPI